MASVRCNRAVALLALMLQLPMASTASKSNLEPAMRHDGLRTISIKGIDLPYARPGAMLAGCDRVKLEPVEVAFRRNRGPKGTGSNFNLSAEERENIATGVARIYTFMACAGEMTICGNPYETPTIQRRAKSGRAWLIGVSRAAPAGCRSPTGW